MSVLPPPPPMRIAIEGPEPEFVDFDVILDISNIQPMLTALYIKFSRIPGHPSTLNTYNVHVQCTLIQISLKLTYIQYICMYMYVRTYVCVGNPWYTLT